MELHRVKVAGGDCRPRRQLGPNQNPGHTCAGISRFDTYKHIVKVRAVSEQHLGMVFDGDICADEAEDGEVYG